MASFFSFDPQVTADMYTDGALRMPMAPAFEFRDFADMTKDELALAATYRWTALNDAVEEGADDNVLDILEKEWLAIFEFRVNSDEDYRQKFLDNRVRMPRDYSMESIQKHRDLLKG